MWHFTCILLIFCPLSSRLRKNLKCLIIAHPSWFIRTVLALSRPFIRSGNTERHKHPQPFVRCVFIHVNASAVWNSWRRSGTSRVWRNWLRSSPWSMCRSPSVCCSKCPSPAGRDTRMSNERTSWTQQAGIEFSSSCMQTVTWDHDIAYLTL